MSVTYSGTPKHVLYQTSRHPEVNQVDTSPNHNTWVIAEPSLSTNVQSQTFFLPQLFWYILYSFICLPQILMQLNTSFREYKKEYNKWISFQFGIIIIEKEQYSIEQYSKSGQYLHMALINLLSVLRCSKSYSQHPK